MLNFVFMCQADFKDKTVYKEISRFRSPNDVFLKVEAAGTAPLKVSVVRIINMRVYTAYFNMVITHVFRNIM